MSAEQESDNHCIFLPEYRCSVELVTNPCPKRTQQLRSIKSGFGLIQEIFLQLGSFGFKIHLRICPKKTENNNLDQKSGFGFPPQKNTRSIQ